MYEHGTDKTREAVKSGILWPSVSNTGFDKSSRYLSKERIEIPN
jgi:hypothetical protein